MKKKTHLNKMKIHVYNIGTCEKKKKGIQREQLNKLTMKEIAYF